MCSYLGNLNCVFNLPMSSELSDAYSQVQWAATGSTCGAVALMKLLISVSNSMEKGLKFERQL